jgi:excisionase family DNA binding protein
MSEINPEVGSVTNQPLLLRRSEIAARLSLSPSKVSQMLASNELPGIVRIGRSVRVSAAALEQWVREQSGETETSQTNRPFAA